MHHLIRAGAGGSAVALAFVLTGCGAGGPASFASAGGSAGGQPSPVAAAHPSAAVDPAADPAAPTPPTDEVHAPVICWEEAEAAALDHVGGGEVLVTEIDDHDGDIHVWEVTVLAPDGRHLEVTVDMKTAAVIGSEVDD